MFAERVNLALGRPCKQGNQQTYGECKNAVDGNLYADLAKGRSCAATANNHHVPWWRVELEQSFEVREVMITNRADCCGDQLTGFEIRVGKREKQSPV